jgi:hypothetical protein
MFHWFGLGENAHKSTSTKANVNRDLTGIQGGITSTGNGGKIYVHEMPPEGTARKPEGKNHGVVSRLGSGEPEISLNC